MFRWIAVVLVVLLVALQWMLWMGGNGMHEVHALRASVAVQKKEDARLKHRNDALEADVNDLKHGEQAVEGRARADLGLIKPGETFYQVVAPASAASAAAGGP